MLSNILNLYYNNWFSETDPKPNGYVESEKRSDVYKKGDLHQILRLANKNFRLTNSTDEPFIFNIHIRLSPSGELRKNLNKIIPKQVINSNCLIVFTDDEGFDAGPLKVYEQCLVLGIDRDRLLYLTPSMKCVEENIIPTMFYCLDWNEVYEIIFSNWTKYLSVSKLPSNYLLSSLVAYPDPHKIYMTNSLYRRNLISNNYVTCQSPVKNRSDTNFLESLIEVDNLPLGKKILDEEGDFNPLDLCLETIKIHRESEVCIFNASPTGRFRRSKQRRWGGFNSFGLACILLANRPFLINSEYPCLDYLRSYGFKTFHPYVDETYDNISNLRKKAEAIVDIAQSTNFDTDEIREISKFNLKLFLSYNSNSKIGQYLENKLLR